MTNEKSYTFLILSNQNFDFDLKTNKWQVANILANRGHHVVFIDPPMRFKALINFMKEPSINLSKLFAKTQKKKENLIVYTPANIFNFKPFSYFNGWFHAKNIKKLLKKDNRKQILYVYHFDYPDLENFVTKFDFDLKIYDVVDEYTAFPEYANKKKVNTGLVSIVQQLDDFLKILLNQKGLSGKDWVLHREEWLAKYVDLVLVSAPGLIDKFRKWKETVSFLPNGGAYELYNISIQSINEPKDMFDIPHPRIGFSGAIDSYKNNINLIEKSAEAYPNYHFIMIGPEKLSDPDLDLSKLKPMQNVHFLGQKPYESLPAYFQYFDAYFIPYNLNNYTKGCFPTKYFDALSAGLPTVVTNMQAYDGFDVDGYVSKSDENFIENIKKAIEENSQEKMLRRKQLAQKNSWEGKVDKQLELIENAL